jgi:hypothetical protein
MEKNKSLKSELTKPDITRSKLSLNKETLRQLKVRTGLKGGAYGLSAGCTTNPPTSQNTCRMM